MLRAKRQTREGNKQKRNACWNDELEQDTIQTTESFEGAQKMRKLRPPNEWGWREIDEVQERKNDGIRSGLILDLKCWLVWDDGHQHGQEYSGEGTHAPKHIKQETRF